jgi:hypothetical protein
VFSAGGGRAAVGSLSGSVGPGFTISFSASSVEEGTYTITIDDQGTAHNFDLIKPGGGSVLSTDIAGTGTTSADVTLTPGTWTYQCDAHSATMHGSFDVTAAATSSSSSTDTGTASTTTSTSTSTTTTTTTTHSTSTGSTATETSTEQTTTEPSTSTSTTSSSTSTQTQTEPTTSTTERVTRVSVATFAVHGRTLLETVKTNASGRATLTLLRGKKRVARARFRLRAGANRLRLTAPPTAHGRHVLVTAVRASEGTTWTARRAVRLR